MQPNQHNYYNTKKETRVIPSNHWYTQKGDQPVHLCWTKKYKLFFEPCGVNFSPSFPAGADENIIESIFPEVWLFGSTCECATDLGIDKHFIISHLNEYWHNNNTHCCNYLHTILLPSSESYQAAATYKQVLTTQKLSIWSCSVATCKIIGMRTSTKLIKVLFDSGSLKTLIHKSALSQNCHFIPNVATISFQALGGRKQSTKAFKLNQIWFPQFNSNISIEFQVAYHFEQHYQHNAIFEPTSLIRLASLLTTTHTS